MKGRPSAALVISCVALFFSLAGAGLAAQHYLITSVHQIKPSVRRALRAQNLVAITTAQGNVAGGQISVPLDNNGYGTATFSDGLARTSSVSLTPDGHVYGLGSLSGSDLSYAVTVDGSNVTVRSWGLSRFYWMAIG